MDWQERTLYRLRDGKGRRASGRGGARPADGRTAPSGVSAAQGRPGYIALNVSQTSMLPGWAESFTIGQPLASATAASRLSALIRL